MTPEYAARLHPGAFRWIHRIYSRGDSHGSKLVEELAGIGNNNRWADDILTVWLEAGWIIREVEPSPKKAQLFFGVGGRPPGRPPSKSTAHPIEYGYQANFDSEGLTEFVTSVG